MLNNTWKDYLNFAKRDRYGILYALFLFIALIVLPQLYRVFVAKSEQTFTHHIEASIVNYRTHISELKEEDLANYRSQYKQNKNYKQDTKFEEKYNPNVELVAFNPNELTKEKAINLGLSQKVSSNIANYLSKGGRFFKAEDFKKIYGMSEANYERLKPYIVLPKKESNKNYKSKYSKEKNDDFATAETFDFDPNTVSIEEAVRLGLSEKLAKRLENYRQKGGKFWKKEDFKKLYGLKETDYERLKPYIVLPKKEDNKKSKKEFSKEKNEILVIETFDFDPNTVSIEEVVRLGLSEKLAKRLENYRQKGGQFWKKEDFKRLYGLKETDYERLKPYIKIAEKEKILATSKPKYTRDWANLKIDINAADTSEWKKIKGIGNSFSARIVKYRTDLGGFVSKEQLKEVYGLDEELYAKIEPHLLPISAETMLPKLNINAATAEMLWRHPYITPTIAKGMVKYRKQHGKFKRIEDLKKLYLIDDELYDKIKVYFRID